MTTGEKSKGRFGTITKYLRKYRLYIILGAASVICTNALMLVTPYITKLVFDLLEKRAPTGEILGYVAIAFSLAVVAGVFRFMMRRTIIWMSRHIEYELRRELFDHLLALSPSFYHDNRTGDIMTRATSDIEAVRMMIGPGIMHIANTAISSVIAISFMVYLSPKLTLYAVAPLILFPIAVNRLGNKVHKAYVKIQESFSSLTAFAQENLAGVRVVRAYRQEEAESSAFDAMSRHYWSLNLEMARVQAVFIPTLGFLASLLTLVVFYFGGRDVLAGNITLGTMVAFMAYLAMLFWPLFALGWVVSLYQRGMASLERINSILHTTPLIQNNGDSPHEGRMKGDIQVRNLRFAYNERPILDGISVHIKPGQTVGLVGPTGSGKTTLISLLTRLYPVPRGTIFIDSVDINDWSLGSLRSQIGVAPQEPFLFSDTIAANIRFGKGMGGDEDIREVASVAALSKDVDSFPRGYDTIVGERGITLSGGQKQRAAIARAVLTDPAILILDDATSSVDTETEHEISERIKHVLAGRTAIVISHRISSVKDADMILYLEEGRIVESGSHDDLVALGGRYADLHRSQLLELELEKL
ncbi:MAG: ABC transporter ATP-binding protein [Candidatus Zixiibacteriota bacterium]